MIEFIINNIEFIIMVLSLPMMISLLTRWMSMVPLPSIDKEEEKKENPMAEAIDDTKKIISYTEEIKKIKNKWIKRHDETISSYMEERNNN